MSEILAVRNLRVSYPIYGGLLGRKIGEMRAVNDVSFSIHKGEVVGLVGESGCGKSTLGKALIRLVKAQAGEIVFEGTDLSQLRSTSLRKIRKRIQMIFQDPFSSLNPRMKVGSILTEPLIIHKLAASRDRRKKVMEILEIVGLRAESYDKYPHEFSGGQRQRIGIARALAVQPEFIIADEPVSALDVSIQSQILNLLKQLQKDFHLTYLFISHDLNVVRYLCDRIVVMYLGRIMEILTREQLVDPSYKKHPYTEALISAVPKRYPEEAKIRKVLEGDLPSPARPPTGCVFHTRCLEAKDICRSEIPKLLPISQAGSQVACHFRTEGSVK